MNKLNSIEYVFEGSQERIIDGKGHGKLSPISLSILDSIIDNKITILFTQGPLNLTPIISCIFVFQKRQDILIGIPKRLFNKAYEEHTKKYFSLVYKCKINSIESNSKFFYYDMLWCKGQVDEEANELKNLDIETRPIHGSQQFRRNYDLDVEGKLRSGKFQKIPKIVLVPIRGIPPIGLAGEKDIKFENVGYKLNKFDPKLIIYESVNNRAYSFDAIIKLINEIEKSDRKLVLHFSWPYLKGLSNFLTKIQDNKDIAIFHLGKRFCIECQKENKFKKPPQNILQLSLEGDLWDSVYYPKNNFLNFKILLPAQINIKNISQQEIESYDWYFDERIENIRNHLKYESIGHVEDNILKYPPVIDTFLCPSDIKMSFSQKESGWISLPLKESISIKSNEKSHAVRAFSGLCSDLEQYRDLSYEFRKLSTNSTITKKTLLQAFLIEKISKLAKKENDSVIDSIIVANFHPYLKTDLSFDDFLNYFIESINQFITNLKLPKIIHEKNNENIISIEKTIKKDIVDNITVKTNLLCEYIEFKPLNSKINKKYFKDITIYNYYNTLSQECKISNIDIEKKQSKWIITIKLEINKENIEKKIEIRYLKLPKIQALPLELIKKSELLLPGPIPFYTISEEKIIISQGYDALLLPFKEIIFFSYPGMNFKQLFKQIKLYNDLVLGNQNNISQRDLTFSRNYTKTTSRFKLPPKSDLTIISEKWHESDTPIDTSFRDEILDESHANKDEYQEIKTLKEIWNSIKQKQSSHTPIPQSLFTWSKEEIYLCVKFETGMKETLSFPVGTLIRKNNGNEYILLSVEELSEGDQIIYIQTDERGSIENYLLKTIFSKDEMTLEDILEPMTALKLFYETLRSLDFRYRYDEAKMKSLYWLSSNQKKNLFDLFYILVRQVFYKSEEISTLLNNSIWNGLITSEKLIEIFRKSRGNLTYEKLYNLSKELGLKYETNSFRALCSTAINEQKHYSFHDEKNLLVLGKLIGHKGIIENYQIINQKGSKIRAFLQQVGHSIRRVANGKADPLNEMDAVIEDKLRKGKVVRMGKC